MGCQSASPQTPTPYQGWLAKSYTACAVLLLDCHPLSFGELVSLHRRRRGPWARSDRLLKHLARRRGLTRFLTSGHAYGPREERQVRGVYCVYLHI